MQLDILYGSYQSEDVTLLKKYSHFLYHYVFDCLIAQGIKIDYPPETKQTLFRLAKISLKEYRKGWITVLNYQKDPELVKFIRDLLKSELDKFYKTYLVRKYLFDLLRNEGKKLELSADGITLKRLELLT